MFRVIATFALIASIYATTTSGPSTILFDWMHHVAMIVSSDGCYEYKLEHNTVESDQLKAQMLIELSLGTNFQQTNHHHINHMTPEINKACMSLPVYQWDLPTGPI